MIFPEEIWVIYILPHLVLDKSFKTIFFLLQVSRTMQNYIVNVFTVEKYMNVYKRFISKTRTFRAAALNTIMWDFGTFDEPLKNIGVLVKKTGKIDDYNNRIEYTSVDGKATWCLGKRYTWTYELPDANLCRLTSLDYLLLQKNALLCV